MVNKSREFNFFEQIMVITLWLVYFLSQPAISQSAGLRLHLLDFRSHACWQKVGLKDLRTITEALLEGARVPKAKSEV